MENNTKKSKGINRRKFIRNTGIGAGILMAVGYLGTSPTRKFLAKMVSEMEPAYDNDFSPIAWFQIKEDNTIILHSPKVEMGQGIFTGLAQLAAEELGVAMSQIQVVNAVSSNRPLDGGPTGGSTSIVSLWNPLRELGAKMRMMLVKNASTILGVPKAALSVKNGLISGNGKAITFGEVVQKATVWNIPKEVTLKSKADFTIIGKPIPRVDLKPKVMGEPIFGIDVTIPDMLYGSLVRPAKVDSQFESANIEKAQKMPGVVKIVVEEDFVGVIAKTRTQAEQAKEAIEVKWKTNKIWQQEEIVEMTKVGKGKSYVIQEEGKPESVLDNKDVYTAEYSSPIGAHAQIEPDGAVAFVKDGKAFIKISTQVSKITRDEVAKRLGLEKEAVEIEATYLGGGFGRRLHTPHAIQAAVMSQAVGKPVHLLFNRKEEFQNDTFRPASHHVLKGKLSADGQLEALEHNTSSGAVAYGSPLVPGFLEPIAGADLGSWRGGMIQYDGIPNYRAISWKVELPFATSWWRSLGLLANTFAIESFMDELAIKAGKDPVKFRLENIKDTPTGKRLKTVIEAAAKKAEWGKKMPDGWAQGFAASTDVNTPVAQVVEVSIENNQIKVHKVTCAIDPGLVVNPDSVKAQCEGAIIMGISASMKEKMVIKDGEPTPIIYGPYQMALMRDAPKEIDIVLIEGDDKPHGVGEPPLGPIGAAVANAVFKITGKRLRDLPLSLA